MRKIDADLERAVIAKLIRLAVVECGSTQKAGACLVGAGMGGAIAGGMPKEDFMEWASDLWDSIKEQMDEQAG